MEKQYPLEYYFSGFIVCLTLVFIVAFFICAVAYEQTGKQSFRDWSAIFLGCVLSGLTFISGCMAIEHLID